MARRSLALLVAAATLVVAAVLIRPAVGRTASSSATCPASYHPVLDPAHVVSVIDNPYFPLPVGRTLVYRGVQDGQKQVDRVRVTARTKIIAGVAATVVSDVAKHRGRLLEKTTDWYAQDDQGNVWYLGEATETYLPNGVIDTSGSWEAGVNGAEPGLIMEADPRVPDAYRQECLSGEAMDTAWVVSRGGSLAVPYGRVHRVLRTLEFTQLEPDVVDEKYYAPGIGAVLQRTLTGGAEYLELVSVRG